MRAMPAAKMQSVLTGFRNPIRTLVLVGVTRLELATSCTPSTHSSHLSYTPDAIYSIIS